MLDGADPENGGHVSACHVGADITAYENNGLEKCKEGTHSLDILVDIDPPSASTRRPSGGSTHHLYLATLGIYQKALWLQETVGAELSSGTPEVWT